MPAQKDFLERMRIASPCNVGWENMSGDERLRFCSQCNLHVYNISAMTSREVASLISSTEGRICARLYRRADGTVLTRDCPVGLRAVRRRISKMAGAMLAAILGICSGAYAQGKAQEDKTCTRIVALKIKKIVVKSQTGTFGGVILDEVGAVIPSATVTLTNEETKNSLTATSNEEGLFKFTNLMAGKYKLEIEVQGFKAYKEEHLDVNSNEEIQATSTLQVNEGVVTVGIVVYTPEIETGDGKTAIESEMIQKLPVP